MYQLLEQLEGQTTREGFSLSVSVLQPDDDFDVLQVTVEGRDEFPVYISRDEQQLLCITYLWTESEVKPESRSELLEHLLELNLPMPLSSFSKIGGQYVVFGALTPEPTTEALIREIETLSDNTLTAVEALQEYLQA
ncbi:hypothetical protein CAI21_07765 [Alkalilimnicola ehrlichii]|uniref:DUF2170 domain-containing protein n=1 Tax=Alkalilimnicola ehrlichii TaxID=351052 RepID=A0A3E0WWQ6_9GAMM|nr:DUF2170 family protein [Alkalilimnicola ehrlichii]RFA30089.1 hypothetical protein CAI21_07765 [Alkalilimnicola ehrlichii]RFA37434.1 hypothetical protein CAL65_09105 [Alkalilimnicola ehrlichii]